MPFAQWDETFSVGLEQFDSQHRQLIELINRLHDAFALNEHAATLSAILNEMTDYANAHFAAEEAMMAQYNYPETAAHKLQHAGFIDRLLCFRGDQQGGNTELAMEVLLFLYQWLGNHVKIWDKQYAAYFKDLGVGGQSTGRADITEWPAVPPGLSTQSGHSRKQYQRSRAAAYPTDPGECDRQSGT